MLDPVPVLQIADQHRDVLQAKHAEMDARQVEAAQEVSGRIRKTARSLAASLFRNAA